ncbi:MAG: hypothetical protein ACRC5C_13150 [Bacilli bacterium]
MSVQMVRGIDKTYVVQFIPTLRKECIESIYGLLDELVVKHSQVQIEIKYYGSKDYIDTLPMQQWDKATHLIEELKAIAYDYSVYSSSVPLHMEEGEDEIHLYYNECLVIFKLDTYC